MTRKALARRVLTCRWHRRPLQATTDLNGRVVTWCEGCDRRRQGKCIDCGRRAVAAEPRCAPCRRVARLARDRQRRQADPARDRQRKRAYEARLSPERKAAMLLQKKKWRIANPRKRLAYQAKARATGHPGYRSREAYLAAGKRYREAHKDQILAAQRRRYYAQHPERPQPVCRACQQPFAYLGRGRPAQFCDPCRPFTSWREKQARRAARRATA